MLRLALIGVLTVAVDCGLVKLAGVFGDWIIHGSIIIQFAG